MDDRPWLRRTPQDPMRGWDGFRSTHNPEVRRFESYPHYQGKQGRPLWETGPIFVHRATPASPSARWISCRSRAARYKPLFRASSYTPDLSRAGRAPVPPRWPKIFGQGEIDAEAAPAWCWHRRYLNAAL